ncbi:DUF4190 domain-containing protein [Streptomyces sp. JJ66]|uniref:DUF4190 domain-containing protein n=1 Tax=Streptomyces sp. JJ66 TaxID=2803843 RepID=UPI001C56B9FB|nr:DUF4190 domain-containing protein [Streptomyces sp. JJ66]MBW1601567.1 DUF4190 domain-containing protein [Streptomyces sp. JJ66]
MSSNPPPPQDPGPYGQNPGYGGPKDPHGGAEGPGGGTGPQDPGPGGGGYGYPGGGQGGPPRYGDGGTGGPGGPGDPYGPGPGGYGGQGYGGPPPSPKNGFGIAALVLGIIAVLLFWTAIGGILLGLLAVIFGILGWRRKKRGEATNGGMSIIGLVLGAVAIIGSVIVLIAGIALFSSEEFSNLTDCLQQAETQAEIDECEQEFNRQFN